MSISAPRSLSASSRFLFRRAIPAATVGGLVLAATMGLRAQAAASNYRTDVEATSAGPLRITPIFHAGVMLRWRGRVIYVDPYTAAYYAGMPKADLILITHNHRDHMDPGAIAQIRKPATIFVVPALVRQTVTEAQDVIANGQSLTVNLAGIKVPIHAVPMYNLVRKRPNGQPFHPKGEGNGYILTLGDRRIYFSGDTECAPEIKALRHIDIAFLCMNLPPTMPPLEAAACVEDFRPKIVYPYHYRGQNPRQFADVLKNTKAVTVRLRNFYPKPPPPAQAPGPAQ